MNEILLQGGEHNGWPTPRSLKRLLWSAAGACALGGLYAWRLEDHWLRIERRDMPLRGLSPEFEDARLAHVADLHCSPIVLESYLRQCVDTINAMGVDFVAVTGDFITGPKCYARRVARVLRHLAPKVATVACLGNHDYGIFHPKGLGSARDLHCYVSEQLAHADLFVMLNESRTFRRGGASLQFVGVEDLWSPHYDPDQAFGHVQADAPVIGLCHNPDAAHDLSHRGAQWILAGHTHGTCIRSTAIRKLALPASFHYFAGHYDLGDGSNLYVNRGLGYGKRVNLNSRPEITVFTLKRSG
ncbi:MAG: putative metallophosphoesterase [Planctomycetes bacterium ADurb.Bin126]|nr:MAG: putative metallophosphoesterase [Planctomycetes bacterium ADurb.Bin126]HOD84717.1 metallophosphoesterase [Phycisphaerae bacterium]HQL72317.1 metallophosphoesterase [Phycisphaerae bacterium]